MKLSLIPILLQGMYIFTIHDFFLDFLYQGGVKSAVSGVFEDLKIKISEGYKQNWSFPVPALLAVSAKSQQGRDRKTSILPVAFWNFKLKVLKYPRNCRLHATLILKFFNKSWIS